MSILQPIILGNLNATKLINFLKKSEKKYPPLSKDQEQAMIAKYKGNREKLNELLVMHNIKFVFTVAKKYMSKTRDFDGLVQEGLKGLAEAAARFDIDRGNKFITYAGWWIRKFMLQMFDEKRNWVERHSTSLNSPALQHSTKSDGTAITYENFINSFIEPTQDHSKSLESELSSRELSEICLKLMEDLQNDLSLSATEKAVFTDIFYNKEKTKDIALKYGLEVPQVFLIKHAILGKFRDILTSLYLINSYDDVNA